MTLPKRSPRLPRKRCWSPMRSTIRSSLPCRPASLPPAAVASACCRACLRRPMERARGRQPDWKQAISEKAMAALKQTIIRTGLETLYFSGAHQVLRPFVSGVGAIVTLHHVRPPRPELFQPNRLLEIAPQFLEDVLRDLRGSDVDLVSLDEIHRRLVEGDFARRFVSVTIDDGYRDTLQWAYPILRRHQAVYIPTSFPDRLGELWWLVLEAVVARNDEIHVAMTGEEETLCCAGGAGKRAAFDRVYGWLRSLATEDELRAVVRALAERYHVNIAAVCDELCMGWDELKTLAATRW